ncbi:MAG: hypothetical protein ACFCVK_04965 [Acidimicrobiales bacterium]
MRGRDRFTVTGLLLAAATLSGALAAVLFSLVLAPVAALLAVRSLTTAVAVGLIAAGLALDTAVLVIGRPTPPTGGRQVPREWAELLDPRVVAVLFGARLGVGPLTILSTWGWWTALLAAALHGVGPAAVVGATFGAARMVVNLVVSLVAERRGHAAWFGLLRAGRRRGWTALNGLGFAVLVSLTLAACGSADRPFVAPDPADGTALRPSLEERAGHALATSLNRRPGLDLVPGLGLGLIGADAAAIDADALGELALGARIRAGAPPSPDIRPATLEDFVRAPATDHPGPGPVAADGARPPGNQPADLAAALPATLDGFVAIDEVGADRFLDLGSASELQPDPTEEVALLETRGFAGGWTRAFRSADNDVAVASVYHFADPAQAEFYLEDGLIMIGGYGGQFFDIAGLPGVRGFSQRFADGGEELVSLGAAFQLGPRWYLIYLVGSPETVTPRLLIPAVRAQLAAAGARPVVALEG